MEEVDSIILHFLRQLKINIDQETKNICELPVEVILKAVSKCLLTINPLLKIPTQLPSGISQRIEVAAQIASVCKDLGYKNDVGYQTFLYFNEAELRQVLMFLIETLPNEGKQAVDSILHSNTKSLLICSIKNKIREDLNTIWIPPCCSSQTQNSVGDFIHKPVKWQSHRDKPLSVDDIVAKLKEIGKDNYLKSTDCTVSDNIEPYEKYTDKLKNKEVQQEKRSLRELKELSIVVRQKLDTLEAERNKINVEYSQAQKLCDRVEAELRNVQNILNNIGISDHYTEGLTDNLFEKIQTNIHMLHIKSEDLSSRNLSLKVEIDNIKNNLTATESQRSICKKILVTLKDSAKSMKEELVKKEEDRKQIIMNYDKVKGGNKRSIYTKRILEIINNVDKQNVEIQKILEDTRQLQKEINALEGQLDRCFSIADETLYRDAKKDDQSKKAYKLLALLHSECNTIVSLVNDTGALARQIVDLEDNIKTERAKKVEDTLKKIHLDIIRIGEESNG